MTTNERWLDGIGIASPCTADWNQMQGDDRCRFCGQCQLRVFNLSAMTRGEAERLVQNKGEGRLCVRFFRRADGTLLTEDCPVGLRQRLRWAWARTAALLLTIWGGLTGCEQKAGSGGTTPPRQLMGEAVAPAPPQGSPALMGDYCAPPAATAVPPVPPQPLMGRVRASDPALQVPPPKK